MPSEGIGSERFPKKELRNKWLNARIAFDAVSDQRHKVSRFSGAVLDKMGGKEIFATARTKVCGVGQKLTPQHA